MQPPEHVVTGLLELADIFESHGMDDVAGELDVFAADLQEYFDEQSHD